MHVAVGEGDAPRPGDIADVEITYAAPHHLNADAGLTNLRRTRGGDAWASRHAAPAEAVRPLVGLGMPSRDPEPLAPSTGVCGTH